MTQFGGQHADVTLGTTRADHVCYLHNELWSRGATSARSGVTMRAKFRARVVIDAPRFPFVTRTTCIRHGNRRAMRGEGNDAFVRRRDFRTLRPPAYAQSISLIGRQLCCPICRKEGCHCALGITPLSLSRMVTFQESVDTFAYLSDIDSNNVLTLIIL